jgi:hypothetical protein
MRKTFWIAAAVFLLLPVWAHTQQGAQQGQSLADAARKVREQKKNAPKAAKVFTNDNIPAISGGVSVVGKAAPAPAGEAGAGETKPAPEEKTATKDEAYWRERFAKAHAQLHQAETDLSLMQRELSQLEVQYYPDPQKALMQEVFRTDINEKRAKIDAKEKEIAQLKQQISDMEDELRKSGGDPGWARE